MCSKDKKSTQGSTCFVILHDKTTGAEFLDEIRMESGNLDHSLLDRYTRGIRSQTTKSKQKTVFMS